MQRTKVVLLDLWKTLVTSHCREPIFTLQKALAHRVSVNSELGVIPDDDFLRFCLTTPIHDPQEFIEEAVRRFGCKPPETALADFERIIKSESGCVARFEDVNPTLQALQDRGYILGVVSNLWPFPAPRIFEANGLAQFFPQQNRIFSFEVRHRKPEREIWEATCHQLGCSPQECRMVGDNLQADVLGSRDFGMKTALIDRAGDYADKDLPEDVPHMHELTQLIQVLDEEDQRAK